MNIVWDIFKASDSALYNKIWNWVMDTFKPKNPTMPDHQVFGKNSKYGIQQFFEDIYDIKHEVVEKVRAKAKKEAIKFLKAFNTQNCADLVQKSL